MAEAARGPAAAVAREPRPEVADVREAEAAVRVAELAACPAVAGPEVPRAAAAPAGAGAAVPLEEAATPAATAGAD